MAQHAGAVLGQILRARRAAMVARGRVAQGLGHVSVENAAFGNADLRRSRRASQNQARLRSCLYSKQWAKRKGPDVAKARPPAQASTGPLQPSHVEPVQSADGEEWYDADAAQPQEYKVPDENLMPTWYARMYVMPFDAVAHAACFKDYGEGTSWKHSEGSDLQMGSQAEG